MNTPRSINEIMNEMNDQAKADGRYLGKAFWEIPRQPGSILDVQETPESRERIPRLRARRLARKRAAEVSGSMEGLRAEEQAKIQESLQEKGADITQ